MIPTRAGNGIMQDLEQSGYFAPPRIESLEDVLAEGIGMSRGRVFADLWDAEQFSDCELCRSARVARLREMNLRQQIRPPVDCVCRPRSRAGNE